MARSVDLYVQACRARVDGDPVCQPPDKVAQLRDETVVQPLSRIVEVRGRVEGTLGHWEVHRTGFARNVRIPGNIQRDAHGYIPACAPEIGGREELAAGGTELANESVRVSWVTCVGRLD